MKEIGKNNGRVAANHTLAYARAAINWCIKLGLTDSANPWTGVSKFKTRARARFLQPDELDSFFLHLKQLPNTDMRDYIYISLFTGARRSNMLAMQWDQINFDLGTWLIPHSKNGDPQMVPLTRFALQILTDKYQKRSSEWVFPGKGRTGHLVEPKKS